MHNFLVTLPCYCILIKWKTLHIQCIAPKVLKTGSMETRTGILSLAISSLFMFSFVCFVKGSLSFNFYADSCPSAELIIRDTVSSFSSTDPSIPGRLLRLVFHDCFVEVSIQLLHEMCFSFDLVPIVSYIHLHVFLLCAACDR